MTNQARGQQFLAELPDIKQDLPYSTTLLRELFAKTGDKAGAGIEDIAATIAKDQGMTAKVLAMANSAFYGLQAQVTSVSRAIALLGLKEIRNLVLILGAQALTRRHAFPPGFELREYWRHQLSTALCAKVLGRRIGGVDADILFTAGVLHDFGKLLTALHRPEDWTAIIDKMSDAGISYSQAEEERWGLEHGLIGAITLDSWNLPMELTEPVNWHHAPYLSSEHSREAKVVCLADVLDHLSQDPNYPVPRAALSVQEEFGIDPDETLAEIAREFGEERLGHLIAQLA